MVNTVKQMNALGKEKIPFLFVIDFAMQEPIVIPLNEVNPHEILFDINGLSNSTLNSPVQKKLNFSFKPVSKKEYCTAFEKVQFHIRRGDSFLINLTMPAMVETNFTLKDIFYSSSAKYKLWLKDKFVVFSPEIFVKINNGIISSYPMKGTIDASIPNAEERLLSSKKELAEHYTIFDS